MALEQKLTLKLAQKLVMTPSLQQAIRLLQMTRIELESAVNIELEQNPVLDEQTSSIDESAGLTLNAPEFALSKSASEEDFEIASIYENIDSH